MQISVATDSNPDALVVGVFNDKTLEGRAQEVDQKLGGVLTAGLADGEHVGKSNEVALFHSSSGAPRRVLLVGLGDRKKFEPHLLAQYAGTAVRYLGKRGVHEISIALPEVDVDAERAASFIAEGALAGTLETTIYRKEQERPIDVRALSILAGSRDRGALERGAAHGTIVGEAVDFARRLALTPANDMTPTHLANRAAEVAKECNLKFDALDEDRMHELGMGALLGVSQGSSQRAKLIVLEYEGNPASNERLALLGKGITFDSGGISLKPPENMHEMKYDMSGGAGVIAAMRAIGKIRPKVNVVGVVPASENLPGPDATKPGDIHRAMNGKTIEIINTDAEGRLILADALCYATMKLAATRLIDCATLTGAMVISLGHVASGVMGSDDAFAARFIAVGNSTGERYWHLPIYPEYLEATKSEIADLKNTGGRPAGSLTAGAFLREFTDGKPWLHLDIAGTAYLDKDSAYQAKGPTGVPVRAFVAYVESAAREGFTGNGVGAKIEPIPA
ncbi:MAG: leucyl aminopeptidase [Candidatus Eremiobacteraeota bacterium]|nr:leucyl aminopeptidase [Candidatus Eremiobacteraeota bacterium]